MSLSRTINNDKQSLADLLHEAFLDLKLKHKCLVNSKNMLSRNIMTRVFNEFPKLLHATQFNKLKTQYALILSKMPTEVVPENINITFDPLTLELIHDFEVLIATYGCDYVLYNSKVKKEIIELLEWKSYQDTLDISDIICSYVGELHYQFCMELFKTLSPLSSPKSNKHAHTEFKTEEVIAEKEVFINQSTNFHQYINKHYRIWAIEAINSSNNYYNPKNRQDLPEEKIIDIKRAHIAVGFTFSALMLGITALTINSLFSSQTVPPTNTDSVNSKNISELDPKQPPDINKKL